MPPEVIEAAYRHKVALLSREQAVMQNMARRWLRVLDALDADTERLAAEVIETARAGRVPSMYQITRMERYRQLTRQVMREVVPFEGYAQEAIEAHQEVLARLGARHGLALVDAAEPGVAAAFNVLPVEAFEQMVGLTAAGTPLRGLIEEAWPYAVDRMTQALANGVARGYGARRIAAEMSQGLTGGLSRVMVIARTETLRVYRHASLEQWRYTGLVEGHQRVSAHDQRVCAACLADEGRVYPLSRPISEHPQGRCTSVPVLARRGEIMWERGAEWFGNQDPQTQQAILGQAKWQAWRQGMFRFEDVLERVPNDTWGESLRVRSLAELTGGRG